MEAEFSQKQVKVFRTLLWDAIKDARDLLMQEIKASEVRTIMAVGQMLDVSVIPQIDDHDLRITKLEEKAAI